MGLNVGHPGESVQGTVVMQLRCGEMFNNNFVANCPAGVSVKNF